MAELTARWPEHRIGPGLDRERALLDLLGNPQQACPVIQIAGTNGKGSTAIMIDSLLRSAGLRVGRYCSPHLVDVTERICIDGRPVSHELFDETWRQIEPMVAMVDGQHIDGIQMTFFEVVTAMAFAAFADAPVDVAVVEVGLGGRWDATNVADATIAVVTPVAMDHMHILGNTIDKIAAEKAGIIKPGCTPVIAGQESEAAPILLAQCTDAGVKPLLERLRLVSRSSDGLRSSSSTPSTILTERRRRWLGCANPSRPSPSSLSWRQWPTRTSTGCCRCCRTR